MHRESGRKLIRRCVLIAAVTFLVAMAAGTATADGKPPAPLRGGIFGDDEAAQFGLWRLVQDGLDGGFVPALAFASASPNLALAGTNVGVFRSVDGGATWAPSREGLPRQATVTEIFFRPAKGDVVVATAQHGVFRSRDDGRTWLPLNEGVEFEQFFAMGVGDGGDLLIGGGNAGRYFRSDDGGVTWEIRDAGHTNASSFAAIVVDPVDPSVVYAAVQAFDSGDQGVYKSIDGGLSFTPANTGLDLEGDVPGVQDLAIDPDDRMIVYAAASCDGLFRSVNGGGSWQRIDDRACLDAVAVDPADGDRIATSLAISTDGGASFEDSVASDTGAVSLAFRPGPSGDLLAGGDEWGVFRSTDAGMTWSPSRAGLIAGQPSDVAALSGTDLVAAINEIGLFFSEDAGQQWTRGTGPDDLEFNRLGFSPSNPDVGYVGSDCNGVFRTDDGGRTWVAANAGIEDECIVDVAVRADDPTTAYAVSDTFPLGKVFITENSGATWTAGSLNLGPEGEILAVAADPRGNGVVYVGVSDPDGTNVQMVYRSDDNGQSWDPTDASIDDGGFGVTALAIDPLDPDVLYATTLGSGTFRSPNAGQTWVQLPGDATFLFDIIIDPANPQRLFNSDGQLSTDAGQSWEDIGPNFPFGFEVTFNPADTRVVYNASFFGVFERHLDEVRLPLPADAAAGDRFGTDVLVIGNEVIVSGPGADGRGAVFVYRREGEELTLTQTLDPPEGFAVEEFGAALALAGDRLVIGAPGDTLAKGNALQAAIFERLQQGWTFTRPVPAPPEAAGGRFGQTLALEGSTLVIGAPEASDAFAFGGGAFVFDLDGDDLSSPTPLAPPSPAAGNRFGASLAIDKGRIAVGSPGSVVAGAIGGSATLFGTVAGNLAALGTATSPGIDPNAAFGTSLAFVGSTLVVGAPGADAGAEDTGRALVFDFGDGGSLVARGAIDPPLADPGGAFGERVDFDGARLVVGAPSAASAAGRQGAVSLFERRGGGFAELDRFLPQDDTDLGFGGAARVEGDSLVVGAPLSDSGAGAAVLVLSTERIFGGNFE